MRYAKCLSTGEIIDATIFESEKSLYADLICPECSHSVTLHRRVTGQHFQHKRGEGTEACDLYQPPSNNTPLRPPHPSPRTGKPTWLATNNRVVDLKFFIIRAPDQLVLEVEISTRVQSLPPGGVRLTVCHSHYGWRDIRLTRDYRLLKMPIALPAKSQSIINELSGDLPTTSSYLSDINEYFSKHQLFPLVHAGDRFQLGLEKTVFIEDIAAVLTRSASGFELLQVGPENLHEVQNRLENDGYEVIADKPASFFISTPHAVEYRPESFELIVTSFADLLVSANKNVLLTSKASDEHSNYKPQQVTAMNSGKPITIPPGSTKVHLSSVYDQQLTVRLKSEAPIFVGKSSMLPRVDHLSFSTRNRVRRMVLENALWKMVAEKTSESLRYLPGRAVHTYRSWNKKILRGLPSE